MFSLFYTHTKTMPILKPTHFYRTPRTVVKYFFNYFGSKKSVPRAPLSLCLPSGETARGRPEPAHIQPAPLDRTATIDHRFTELPLPNEQTQFFDPAQARSFKTFSG